MGTVYNSLQRQLKLEEHKETAKDCLKIYDKLKELNNGSVWSSDWHVLTKVTFEGIYPNSIKIYRPSSIGYVFLKGIEK